MDGMWYNLSILKLGGANMTIDYKPLWHQLLDRDMSRTELRLRSGISTRQLAKLGRNEDVNTDVLRRICATLNCSLSDVVNMTPEQDFAQHCVTESRGD